ncbi:MAG: PKD domain-containing protein [Candidatus Brocadiia bacterium]
MRLLRAVLVAAWACVLVGGGPARGADWERFAGWQACRTVEVPAGEEKQPRLPGLECCYVSFPTATFLQPEGRDLRVAAGSERAPFRVVDIGFGGRVRLVVGLPAEARQFQVYYGNPKAKKPAEEWVPRRGLWLETRPYEGGDCTSLAGIRKVWEGTAERYGRGPVGQIHQGHNPFGPSDNYLSHYTGWLHLPEAQRVHFAVSADDIAYLLVDGRVVASKSRWGGMPRRKRFAGEPVALEAGLHAVEMYHAEREGKQAASAAWWKPGMRRGEKYRHYKVIPAAAYAPLRYGRLADYRVRGQAVGADFAYANEGDVPLNDQHLLVRFAFRDRSRPADRALRCQPRWEFGDGTSSTARDPDHVYLRPGDYTVTLSLTRGSRTYAVSQKLRAGPGWGRAVRREWDRLAHYYPIVRDYQFEKMATEDLVVLVRVLEVLEEEGDLEKLRGTEGDEEPQEPYEIVPVCRELYQRGEELDDETFVHVCLLLGRHIRGIEGQAREAIRVFTRAELRTDDVHAKARLANEKGDVYYYFLDDLEAAEREYTKTLTDYKSAADSQVRLAQIRVGDLYRTKGQAEKARRAYQAAAAMPIHERPTSVETARRGSFARSAEDYLRRELYDEARQVLNDWEWEFPTDKLEGYATYLRIRLAIAEDNMAEALKQARELIGRTKKDDQGVSKDSEYADDILLLLAETHAQRGDLDEALRNVDRLLEDYPASALQEKARLQRVVYLLQQGNHQAAAQEALRFQEKRPHSDRAPRALLLAAEAMEKQGAYQQAIKTLERLTRTYRDSDEAAQAIEKLKELRRR